jgi:hypothetical protein
MSHQAVSILHEVPARVASPSPVMAREAEWRAATLRALDHGLPDSEVAAHVAAASLAAKRMALTAARTPGDIAAKLAVFRHEVQSGTSREGDELLNSIGRDLARLS